MGQIGGPVVAITGASSGIGRAIADKFLSNGYRLSIMSRTKGEAFASGTVSDGRITAFSGDVTNENDLDAFVRRTLEAFGSVDVVIPNAGSAKVIPFENSDRAAIADQFNINFVAATETVRRFLPHIREGGSIIFVTTFLTTVGFPGLAIYSASKAALKSFGQTLAAELAPRKVRVNSIAPGPISTPLWGKVGLSEDALAAVAGQVNERLLPGSFGHADDIAEAALFLASEKAKNIFGHELVVDGGYTVG